MFLDCTCFPCCCVFLSCQCNILLTGLRLGSVIAFCTAVLEMVTVASHYGATDQPYHYDVNPELSGLGHARSFASAHSVLIQLQNTTAAMGATQVCPGTQYCGDFQQVYSTCRQHGFSMVVPPPQESNHETNATPVGTDRESEPYWPAGDAAIMNLNVFHRGAEHVDPEPGRERVLVILAFGAKPRPRAESRQSVQKVMFAVRADLFVSVV